VYFFPEVDLNLKAVNGNKLLPLLIQLQCFGGEQNVTEISGFGLKVDFMRP